VHSAGAFLVIQIGYQVPRGRPPANEDRAATGVTELMGLMMATICVL